MLLHVSSEIENFMELKSVLKIKSEVRTGRRTYIIGCIRVHSNIRKEEMYATHVVCDDSFRVAHNIYYSFSDISSKTIYQITTIIIRRALKLIVYFFFFFSVSDW